MDEHRHHRLTAPRKAAIRAEAQRRVEAVWTCLGVLCPDMPLQEKNVLAEKVLDLCAGEKQAVPKIQITPAQVQEIVWRNMQCLNPRCPMVLFSREIADELNEFFGEEE